MSKLMEASAYPKTVETQSAASCLRVFCRETYTAVINHPGMRNIDGRDHTAAFIKILVNWSMILNVMSVGVDLRFNKNLQPVVQDHPDDRLNTSLRFGKMASQMKVGGKRYKQFTQDIAMRIHHTSNSIVSLSRSSTLTRSCLDIIRGLSRTTTKMELFL